MERRMHNFGAVDMSRASVAIDSLRGYDSTLEAEDRAGDEFTLAQVIRDEREMVARRCAEIAESAQGMQMHVEGALAVATEIRREFGL